MSTTEERNHEGSIQVSEPDSPSDSSHLRFLRLLLVLSALGLWLLPATMSLWLDETGTFWVVKDGLHNTIDRAIRFEGQSPLYYLIVFIAKRVGGTSELALRAPSLIACGLAAFFLYRLGSRLFDRATGLVAAIILAVAAPLVTAASDARPYAVGLMLLIAATLALVRWVQEGRAIDGFLYVLLASLTIYAHYLFALPLAAHPIYVLMSERDDGKVKLKQLLLAIGGIVLCVLPAVTQVSSLFNRRTSLTIVAPLSFDSLASVFTPAALTLGLVVGWLATRSTVRATFSPRRILRPTLVLLGIWLLVPPLSLYVLSILTPTTLFQGRYYLTAVPAFSLLVGWIVGSFTPARAVRLITLTVAIFSILTVPAALSGRTEDWRAVAAAVNHFGGDTTPVFVDTDFIESIQPSWLTDPERKSYLMAPFAYYKMRGDILLLPGKLSNSTEPYLEGLARRIKGGDRFFVVTRLTVERWRSWAFGEAEGLGFREVFSANYGQLYVQEFRRPIQPPSV